MSRRGVVLGAAALVAIVVAAGAAWFEPWRLFTSSRVEEDLPTVSGGRAAADAGDGGERGGGRDGAAESEPRELGSGAFEDAEHATTGTARVLELSDGSRLVRLEDLDTSDGPDLVVALSDAPSGGEWGSYDDGRLVDLGDLKATSGDQNYEIAADVDLDGLTTVVVWRDRFDVAFGTATVGAVGS